MDIITRSEAKSVGVGKYFTGVACKNGHVDYRYTQSGACQSCLRSYQSMDNLNHNPSVVAANEAIRLAQMQLIEAKRQADAEFKERMAATRNMGQQDLADKRAQLVAKKAIFGQLVVIKLRLFQSDVESLALLAFALATMRFPSLVPDDVRPNVPVTGREPAGTALYSFYCHGDDIQTLRDAANATFKANHPVDIAAAHRAVALRAEAYLPKDTTPPMNWK